MGEAEWFPDLWQLTTWMVLSHLSHHGHCLSPGIALGMTAHTRTHTHKKPYTPSDYSG